MSDTKLRYSKQRETIYEVLREDPSHPNVDTIYMNVRQIIPDISLGTVYRNLNLEYFHTHHKPYDSVVLILLIKNESCALMLVMVQFILMQD